jgi:hypothetical protein
MNLKDLEISEDSRLLFINNTKKNLMDSDNRQTIYSLLLLFSLQFSGLE